MSRYCTAAGYRYTFTGKSAWRLSKDDRWDITMGKAMCGRKLGIRHIDDAKVTVVKCAGRIYASKNVRQFGAKKKRS